MKLLYVEDNPFDRDLTRRALLEQMPGLVWDTADSVQAAQAKLQQQEYDVLLLDMWLQDGSGLDVLLYARRRKLAVAVVAVAGAGDEASVIQFLKAGAQDYVPKRPQYLDTLGQRLQLAVERKGTAVQLPTVLTVLYVESHLDDIELTRRQFARRAPHLELVLQADAASALAWLHSGGRADVALLDYRLPGMDGIELLAALKQHSPALSCVLITGRGDEMAASQAMHLGAVDYVIKEPGYIAALPWVIEHAHLASAYAALCLACKQAVA
ncbi:MAG: response regulator [Thiobacillus sp.]